MDLREHSFVATERCIYRVFGSCHPRDMVLLLLRYYMECGSWRKPPVYGAESFEHEWINQYDLPVTRVPRYGLVLALGDRDAAAYVRAWDPCSEEAIGKLATLGSIANCTIGLAGSHLVGLERESSDVDIVLYGPEGVNGAERILERCSDRAVAVPPSRTFARLFELARGKVPRAGERNIYTGRCPDLGLRKLDLLYSPYTDGRLVDGDPLEGETCESSVYENLVVVEAGGRQFFPGELLVETSSGERFVVSIVDHLCAYLLPGDRFTMLGIRVSSAVGERVLAVQIQSVRLDGRGP